MWWYLSFADEKQWLGAAVVRGRSIPKVLTRSHLLGLNPGGEVQLIEIPPEVAARIPDEQCEVFLTDPTLVENLGSVQQEV